MMMPKCTGSIPSATMIGNRVGVAISRIAVVSMKQPRNSSATLMIARITGSCCRDSTASARPASIGSRA